MWPFAKPDPNERQQDSLCVQARQSQALMVEAARSAAQAANDFAHALRRTGCLAAAAAYARSAAPPASDSRLDAT